jgi:hypothetical protein
MSNNIFSLLDVVLKKQKKEIIIDGCVSRYLLNRYVSMCSTIHNELVNMTVNRWGMTNTFKDEKMLLDFYKVFLPKHTKKIYYIKREPKKECFDDNDINLRESLEISQRELNDYKRMLA